MLRALARSTSAALVLFAACSDSTAPSPAQPGVALAVGGLHACAVIETHTRCWGRGSRGQLGIGVTPEDSTPVTVAAPPLVSLVAGTAHTCGLDAEGKAYCWGSNEDGQLGTTEPIEACPLPCATTPKLVAGNLRFQVLASGTEHTCGLTMDGSAYFWGLNDIGQLGWAPPLRTRAAPMDVAPECQFRCRQRVLSEQSPRQSITHAPWMLPVSPSAGVFSSGPGRKFTFTLSSNPR